VELSYQHTSDEDLMKQYLAGDNQAFAELISRYERPLLNFANCYLRNLAASEDITQDIFVRIVESKQNYQPDKPFKPWLYQIARNRIYDELRKKKRWSLLWFQSNEKAELDQKLGTLPDTSLSQRETLNQDQLNQILMRGIQSLDNRSRDMVILRYIQGLSVREVADILGVPEGTVHSGTHRALESLQKILIKLGLNQEDIL
jgi:RNA polymerase sigma-70 factor, ECF subfamily